MNLYFKVFKSDMSKFNSPSQLSSCMDNTNSDTAHSCSQVGIYSFPWDSPLNKTFPSLKLIKVFKGKLSQNILSSNGLVEKMME